MNKNIFNAYEILEISINATTAQIQKAYKRMALEYHPDRHGNSKPANAMFRMIVKAKEILLNPSSRLEHDYAIGIKKKPVFEQEPEVIYIEKENDEIDWAPIIGAGLVGLAIGAAISKKRSKKKMPKK